MQAHAGCDKFYHISSKLVLLEFFMVQYNSTQEKAK